MCAAAAHTNFGGRRIALLIGNNKYTLNPLQNCVNDAKDMSAALSRVGFHVTTKTDLAYEKMDKQIEEFAGNIKSQDFVLFFFSGHGVQWEDQNYLIPCDDDRIKDWSDLKYRATNAQRFLELMSNRKPFTIIYLLDCCRTYWLPSIARSRDPGNMSRGMAPMSASGGSLIAFACAPGKTAADTAPNHRNGVFTYNLLKHITKPGEKVTDMMIHVTDGVATDTGDKQVPYTTSAIRRHDVYLVPPTTVDFPPNPKISGKFRIVVSFSNLPLTAQTKIYRKKRRYLHY